uniref:Ig-like domain-containing protein n=1 Tax=Cynoglossus semilaevis TaxID=244447 RepID=A0A3P8X192_CYNSE
PSQLVVKHLDPTSATCHLCPSCQRDIFDLEVSFGKKEHNTTAILWTVNKMVEWNTLVVCFYVDRTSAEGKQCCSVLPILVYEPPDGVSLSIVNHTGPMLEARVYTLQCEVQNVAPLKKAHVTFYEGSKQLNETQVKDSPALRPVNETYSLQISAQKENDGAQYWCKVEMVLGPEGPQPPPVMMSQNVTAIVHLIIYEKPSLLDRYDVIVEEGRPLHLDCTAEGNPQPSYQWVLLPDSVQAPDSSIINITAAAPEHSGLYTCSVTNDLGTLTVDFMVKVKGEFKNKLLLLHLGLKVKLENLSCDAFKVMVPEVTWKNPHHCFTVL